MHGFGHVQYGYDKGPWAANKGSCRRHFTVPADWRGRTIRILFDAVMTDTLVKVNGVVAGPAGMPSTASGSVDRPYPCQPMLTLTVLGRTGVVCGPAPRVKGLP